MTGGITHKTTNNHFSPNRPIDEKNVYDLLKKKKKELILLNVGSYPSILTTIILRLNFLQFTILLKIPNVLLAIESGSTRESCSVPI